MRLILSMVLVFALTVGGAFAGCGKKVTNKGTLEVDAEKKLLTVTEAGGAKVELKLTPDTQIMLNGESVSANEVNGLKGSAVSEHKKVDKVMAMK